MRYSVKRNKFLFPDGIKYVHPEAEETRGVYGGGGGGGSKGQLNPLKNKTDDIFALFKLLITFNVRTYSTGH